MSLIFDNSYARLPERFFQKALPAPASQPETFALNSALVEELGLPLDVFESAEAAQYLSGNTLFPGSEPIALAYAGHQFGGFSPQLGDGRAHLLGEILAKDGTRVDLQLKGSGPTAFSRGGDGRAALGPVLREYLVSESMHALGVPTTRSLAAVTTGDPVYRNSALPGAVLTRVASSHLRVGTFEYFSARGDIAAMEILVNYALERHFHEAQDGRVPAAIFLDSVISVQARLVAQWMSIGFVHGVMNTDNCAISGETIDYGPCAFLDAFVPSRSFSSIDRGGRYAFDQQPKIAQWNLARLAEALLPLLGSEEGQAVACATDLLHQFPERYEKSQKELSSRKLGIDSNETADGLNRNLRSLMAAEKADFTLVYYQLAPAVEGKSGPFLELFPKNRALAESWLESYRAEVRSLPPGGPTPTETMRRSNPLYIPRNHQVERALDSAENGDSAPFFRLLSAVQNPFAEAPSLADLAVSPGEEQWSHVTFCGT